jgi:hypothetical protein
VTARKLRKLWSTTNPDSDVAPRVRHESQPAAYRWIRNEAANWPCRPPVGQDMTRHVDVWVDERRGHGWELFERIDLADYGTTSAPTKEASQ